MELATTPPKKGGGASVADLLGAFAALDKDGDGQLDLRTEIKDHWLPLSPEAPAKVMRDMHMRGPSSFETSVGTHAAEPFNMERIANGTMHVGRATPPAASGRFPSR